jgi:patatin-like phospholipase/acyl hydrolase
MPEWKPLADRFSPGSPKRILSLDGGGIRGALTLGYLEEIEKNLAARHPHITDFRLAHYFDLIGGTSTGAIIAASLAIGLSVKEIKDKYMQLGDKIFAEKRDWWKPWETFKFLKAGYNHSNLEAELKSIFKNYMIGGSEIKTGLCIVAKRADTNSTWPIINHPNGKFYNTAFGKNKDIPLWQAVRASSAAPSYFAPQLAEVGNGVTAAFVDGGLSMANNPALTLLMVANLRGFPFHWPLGDDKLLITSVGTGYGVFTKFPKEIEEKTIAFWAKKTPDMFMQDASWQNQIMLQWLSNTATPKYIDMEIEDMKGDILGGRPLISYLRYNFEITQNSLNGLGLGRSFENDDTDDVLEMSNAHNKELLYEIGSIAAKREILSTHFPPVFDVI